MTGFDDDGNPIPVTDFAWNEISGATDDSVETEIAAASSEAGGEQMLRWLFRFLLDPRALKQKDLGPAMQAVGFRALALALACRLPEVHGEFRNVRELAKRTKRSEKTAYRTVAKLQKTLKNISKSA